jgi:hypothetical protein
MEKLTEFVTNSFMDTNRESPISIAIANNNNGSAVKVKPFLAVARSDLHRSSSPPSPSHFENYESSNSNSNASDSQNSGENDRQEKIGQKVRQETTREEENEKVGEEGVAKVFKTQIDKGKRLRVAESAFGVITN